MSQIFAQLGPQLSSRSNSQHLAQSGPQFYSQLVPGQRCFMASLPSQISVVQAADLASVNQLPASAAPESKDNISKQPASTSGVEGNQPKSLAEVSATAAESAVTTAQDSTRTDELRTQQQPLQHVIDIHPSRPQSRDGAGAASKQKGGAQQRHSLSSQESALQEQQQAQAKRPADGMFFTPGSQVHLSAQPQRSNRSNVPPTLATQLSTRKRWRVMRTRSAACSNIVHNPAGRSLSQQSTRNSGRHNTRTSVDQHQQNCQQGAGWSLRSSTMSLRRSSLLRCSKRGTKSSRGRSGTCK